MTSEKLDKVDRELRHLHPHLPEGAISRATTLAYLGAPSPSRPFEVAASRPSHHQIWLEQTPAAEIARSINVDVYLALGALHELAYLRNVHAGLDGLRTCLQLRDSEELLACLEAQVQEGPTSFSPA
jgi:hypothetical protein